MSQLQTWMMAIRPKTLPAAIAPVIIGTAMAFGDGVQDFVMALWCLAGALLIQINCNLVNDYFDFQRGADVNRVGPTRVTQAGLVKPWQMITAIILSLALIVFVCIQVIKRGGWPIAIIGITSIISGVLYTAGPFPLGYLGLGEIFVFIFFGPVAVAGTYYVQSLEMNPAIILAGFAPGFFSSAILAVNNIRDREGDILAGKKTLAARFGDSFGRIEFLILLFAGCLIPVLLVTYMQDHWPILSSVLVLFLSIPTIILVLTQNGAPLNNALAKTGKLLLIYTLIFSLTWII